MLRLEGSGLKPLPQHSLHRAPRPRFLYCEPPHPPEPTMDLMALLSDPAVWVALLTLTAL